MGKKTVAVSKNLFEKIHYQNYSFPIFLYQDVYDEFLNGEINAHWHDEFEFNLILKGSVEFQTYSSYKDNHPDLLQEGDGIFINAKSLHHAKQLSSGAIMFGFVIPANFFNFHLSEIIYKKNVLPIMQLPLSSLCFFKDNKEDYVFLDALKRFYDLDSHSLGYEIQSLELVYRIWNALLQKSSNIPVSTSSHFNEKLQEQRARQMLSYIYTHYNQKITIADLCKIANISRSECFRCFKNVVGKSPMEYVSEYQLSQAAQLLSDHNLSIAEISEQCGFQSQSYFGKIFREKYGFSPKNYQKNLLQMKL